MKGFIHVVGLFTAIAAVISGGAPAMAVQEKPARKGPVVLMMTPESAMLRVGEAALGPQGSIIIVDDAQGNRLGIAEIPGRAKDHLVTRRNADGIDEVIATKDGEFKLQRDRAVDTISVFMREVPMYKAWEACGSAYCRRVGADVDCACLYSCVDCVHIVITD